MKISEILCSVGVPFFDLKDEEIHHVSSDSRECGVGSLFVCIKGAECDGHDFIEDAYARGTRSFIVEQEMLGYDDCNIAFVENSRKILAEISFLLERNPEKHLKIIAVTGTKGKSTVV